ncbi:MAG: amidohydrolase family protein, partial [Actinomycetota bacterium]
GLKRLAEWATAKEQPLLLHASEPLGRPYPGKGRATPDKYYRLAVAYPDLKLVLAHWGGGLPFFELLVDEGKPLANVYYDCAATPYLYRPEIFNTAISLAGRGKILFGTDYPLMPQDRYIKEIESLTPTLNVNDHTAIMGNNALELLGVPRMPSWI